MYEYFLLFIPLALVFLLKRHGSPKLMAAKKSILITGCDSGVGLFSAIAVHKLGFKTIATCLDTNGYGAQFLREQYPDILVIKMDVTNINDVEHSLKTVEEFLTTTRTVLWGLINNAGILVYGDFSWQLESQALLQINVNLVGVLRVTKVFQRLLHKAKGRIINITSANGNWCLPGLSVYCATKHAVEGFSNALRLEMIPWDVKVILINPGNLPGSTRLLAGQQRFAEAMKENFTPEDLNLYGDYFERLQKHLQANFSPSTPDQVQQPPKDCGLKEVLESALLLENPKSYYENISFGFRIFILVTKLLPTYYADRMKLRMWGSSVGYKLV